MILYSKFALENRLNIFFEALGNGCFVKARVLGPLELGFVDVTVGVTNGGDDHLVSNTKGFNKWDHLWSNGLY